MGRVALLLTLGVVAFLVRIPYDANEFRSFEPIELPCHLVSDATGPEDFVVLEDNSLLTSSDDRSWLKLMGAFSSLSDRIAATPNGKIVRLKDGKFVADMALTGFPHQDFHPHGLALYPTPDEPLLFVINHRRDGEFVDVFAVDADVNELHYQRSFHHELFRGINDIDVVSSDAFYVTNWLYNVPGSLAGVVDTLLQRAVAYVIYCESNDCRIVVSGLKMANGIHLDADASHVYVVETIAKRINVYLRNPDNSLTFSEHIPTTTLCDNIQPDPANPNVYYLGCHPKGLTFTLHALNHHNLAPSQVLKLTKESDGKHTIKAIYYNDGTEISASSGAVAVNGLLYIGQVHNNGVLVCDLNQSMQE